MKILFLNWPCYGAENWIYELVNQGHEITDLKVSSLSEDDDIEYKQQLIDIVINGEYEALCSFNFFPLVSIIARETNCRYISWVYDSPLLHIYSLEVRSPFNYIFLFDKKQYAELHQKGVKTVYHLPLAGVSGLSDYNDIAYCSDITFVGKLYRSDNYFDEIIYLPDKLRGFLEGIMEAQRRVYGYYMLPELVTDDIQNELKNYIKLDLGTQFDVEYNIIFSSLFLAKKTANLERESMLLELAKYFEVKLYSDERMEHQNILNCGSVAYGPEMYKLFNRSKININSTLRCIQTGINLRTIDILSAGGFCLTNYQEELSENFAIGKDLEVYESEADLIEKTAYYLKHEELRKEIADNGKRKIEEFHNYKIKVKKMMDIVTSK